MTEQMTLDEVMSFFTKSVSSVLNKHRNDAQRQINRILTRIQDVKDAAKRFDYSDINDPDVYQNYATTIYRQTTEIMDRIVAPEKITYNTLEDFDSLCKNQINACINMLAKYLSWLKRDRSYKTKVKNLDRALTLLKKEVANFESKTLISYGEVIDFEKVISDIEQIKQLTQREKELISEIEKHKDDVERLTKEIEEKQKELDELLSHPGFKKLEENKKELEQIEITISNKVSEIKKLSSKVLKAAESRKIELDEGDRELIKSIVKDPLGTFVKEGDGYYGIKAMLSTLENIVKSSVIQMKKDKLERALENILEIKNDGLLEEQKRAKFLIQQTEAIKKKFAELEIDLKIQRLKRDIENLKIDRERITLSLKRELNEVQEQIKSLIKSVEERVYEFTSKSIEIIVQ
ncbi:MAG: hypothetical protein ACTSYD_01795 [Candidatus Heimdallarchaeaceae archaeon]